MEITFLLLKQNGIMLIYLLIGYFLFKKELVSKQGSADMGRMLLYIIMPMAILKSYMRDFSLELLAALAESFALALAALLLSVFVSRIIFRKEESVERFGAAFSNAGFIGIPLVQMTLGEEAVFYVASFVAILNILQWTYGVYIMTGDRSVIRVKKIVTNPIVLSFLAGVVLFFAPFDLPQMLQDTIGTLATMNGPVAMIVLGTYLAQIPLKELFTEKLVYKCTAVRLLLIPGITLLLLLLFPMVNEIIRLAVLIAATAPVGSNVAIFAQLYGQEYTRAVKEVCLSTLFCILTLPVMIGIANVML